MTTTLNTSTFTVILNKPDVYKKTAAEFNLTKHI
jgi:hypothetical protein